MDRKLTPQQELSAAKARVRAHASGLDLSIAVNRRLAGSLFRARNGPRSVIGALSSVVLPLVGLVGLLGRGVLARRR